MFSLVRKLAALALCISVPAAATAEPGDGVVTARLLPGWRTQQGTHMAALQLDLAEGWKTYWRAPGDAGIPPRFDWEGSSNLESVRMHWPRPGVFETNGMRSIGYRGSVVLPLEFTPRDEGEALHLAANISLGVCETVCVPVSLTLDAELAPDMRGSDPRILEAIAAKPETGREAGVADVRCSVEPISDGLRVTVDISVPAIGASEVAVLELPDQGIWISEAMTRRNGTSLTAVADMVPPDAQPFAFSRSDLRVTLISGDRAVNIEGCDS